MATIWDYTPIERLDFIEDKAQSFDPPEEDRARVKKLQTLRRLMATSFKDVLSPRDAEVVRLRMAGLGLADIARLLSVSYKTVANHLRVARRRLKEVLVANE